MRRCVRDAIGLLSVAIYRILLHLLLKSSHCAICQGFIYKQFERGYDLDKIFAIYLLYLHGCNIRDIFFEPIWKTPPPDTSAPDTAQALRLQMVSTYFKTPANMTDRSCSGHRCQPSAANTRKLPPAVGILLWLPRPSSGCGASCYARGKLHWNWQCNLPLTTIPGLDTLIR